MMSCLLSKQVKQDKKKMLMCTKKQHFNRSIRESDPQRMQCSSKLWHWIVTMLRP